MSDDWTPPDPTPDEVHRITVALKGAFAAGVIDAADDLGLDFDFLLPQAAEYGAERGAELIGKKWVDGILVDNPNAEWVISDTTRDGANAMLREALDEGWSYQKFSSRLEESGLFTDARADLIARNEISLAFAGGKVRSFREADVGNVVIYDEDGCDEPVCDVDGETWTLEEYEAEPLGHPNCTRDARPQAQSDIASANAQEEEAA